MNTPDLRHRVDTLNTMIQQGRIMEAMEEFYADNVVMSENDAEPTVGLAANLEREQALKMLGVPAGRPRVVFVGDSMTFGQSVVGVDEVGVGDTQRVHGTQRRPRARVEKEDQEDICRRSCGGRRKPHSRAVHDQDRHQERQRHRTADQAAGQ